tara:strand:+ start:67 stop:360 length:294 start_codon:yes stop_codon:yes gene_type:complete
MIIKVHKTQEGRVVLSICDKEILGKKFEEGNLQLDLSSSFYAGEESGENKIRLELRDANIVNIVGEKSVNFCVKLGIVDVKTVGKIKGIPHVQVVLN